MRKRERRRVERKRTTTTSIDEISFFLTSTTTQSSFPAAAAMSSGLWPEAEQIRALVPCLSSFETARLSPLLIARKSASVDAILRVFLDFIIFFGECFDRPFLSTSTSTLLLFLYFPKMESSLTNTHQKRMNANDTETKSAMNN